MKITIIGAGFSGLTLAYLLKKRGVQVEIFEQGSEPGGLIHTRQEALGLVESAANGVWNTPLTEELFADVGVSFAERLPTRKNRYIFRGRPRRWPLTISESARLLLSLGFCSMSGSKKPQTDETVAQWGCRIGGPAFTARLLAPALQGVYAGDVSRMSAELVLGRFFESKKSLKPAHRGTVAPVHGMGELIEKLTAWLGARDVRIHFSSRAEPRGQTVVATSAWTAAEILRDSSPELARQLSGAESVPLISATLFFSEAPRKYRGFGCLFPSEEKFHSLGALFNTDIFCGRGRGRSETWILGGAGDRGVLEKTDAGIIGLILKDRARVFDPLEPLHFKIQRWPQALPHYTVAWKNTLAKLNVPKGLYLTGNYLGAIGLSRILEYNRDLADRIVKGS